MLTNDELATILAALRMGQRNHSRLAASIHFADGSAKCLTVDEIENLCERLNCDGVDPREPGKECDHAYRRGVCIDCGHDQDDTFIPDEGVKNG